MSANLYEGLAPKWRGLQRFLTQHSRVVRFVLWTLIIVQTVVISWFAGPWETGDSGRYLELSHNLVAGKGYVVSCGGHLVVEGWRLPGYPLFLAGMDRLFGPSLIAVVACQLGLYLASIFLLYRLAKRLGPWVPLVFLLLCAAYPAVTWASALILTEALCVFLITLSVCLLARPSWVRCTAAGLALGASAYCRPNLLPLGLVVAAGMVVAQRKFRPAVLVAAFSVVALLPLSVWNYAHFRKFTPLPALGGSGVPLFYGVWESVLPSAQLTEFCNGGPPSKLLVNSGMMAQLRKINLAVGTTPDNPSRFPRCSVRGSEKADELLRAATLRDAERWPGAYLWHEMRVGVTNWFPTLALRQFPKPLRILLWIDVIAVPLLGFIGLFSLARRSGEARLLGWVGLASAAYFTFSLGWFVSQSRYTVPVRLILVLGAAAFLDKLLTGRPETAMCAGTEVAVKTGVSDPGPKN